MTSLRLTAALATALAIAGCSQGDSADAPEDRSGTAVEISAPAAGPAAVALGLPEATLLDADLLAIADGAELGEVAGLLRRADGTVDRLLIELAGSDRFVELPVTGLAVLARGEDTDLITTLPPAQLAALPPGAPPAN